MAILDKSTILNVNDTELEEYEVEEWGGSICMGAMTVEQRLNFESTHCDEDGSFINIKDPELIFDLLALSIRTEAGDPMFTTDDIRLLNDKSAKVVHGIFNQALTVNYKTKESVEDIKKN